MNIRRICIAAFYICIAAMAAQAATPRIVAHRGYWDTEGSAQNSIRSLIKADSIGCWGSEFDVWITADDQLVLNHDGIIDGHVVEKETLAQLAEVRLPNGESIPTLSQFLDSALLCTTNLVLELKEHKDSLRELIAVPLIAQMICERGLQDRTTFITFSATACKAFVELGLCPVYYLTSTEPAALKQMGVTGPDYNQGTLKRHPEWVKQFRQWQMPINVWTVTKPDDLQWAVGEGFDFITTNDPVLGLRLVAE